MPALVTGLLLLALLLAGVWVTFGLLGMVVTLVVAGIVGWVADRLVPGELPYGWLGAIVAGLLGSWLGSLLLGPVGPSAGGIPVLPALVGAVILAFAYDVLHKRLSKRPSRARP
ncbi:GlsB/YeaQ/YmgE family stress response membrane protein [Sorangium sp. So ce1099]|uniref:GlsB/YeaQ/YmgE family stress response membrane protein n=1 Tax=Sorangium sp. So ce1099 TaxID=3133331 RepID=UPI003F5D5CCA